MFLNFFKKQSEPDFSYDQAVILDIDLASIEDFGTEDQRQEIEELENTISRLLPENSGLDGDEFGEGTCTIYLYGPSANTIYTRIGPTLRASSFNHIDVTLQYGRPEDPDTKDKKFTL